LDLLRRWLINEAKRDGRDLREKRD
jgi:hypothetical protein